MWQAIQLICFVYFQASSRAAVAPEAAREGQDEMGANEERAAGEEMEEDSCHHAAVGESRRTEATGEADGKTYKSQ